MDTILIIIPTTPPHVLPELAHVHPIFKVQKRAHVFRYQKNILCSGGIVCLGMEPSVPLIEFYLALFLCWCLDTIDVITCTTLHTCLLSCLKCIIYSILSHIWGQQVAQSAFRPGYSQQSSKLMPSSSIRKTSHFEDFVCVGDGIWLYDAAWTRQIMEKKTSIESRKPASKTVDSIHKPNMKPSWCAVRLIGYWMSLFSALRREAQTILEQPSYYNPVELSSVRLLWRRRIEACEMTLWHEFLKNFLPLLLILT
jgi:hypothetical protein